MTSLFCSIHKGLNLLYRAAGVLAALCMVALAFCVLTSIVTRLLDMYVGGLTEYAGYLMAAANFLALAYTFRSGGHIRISLFIGNVSRTKHRFIELWCFGVATFVSGYLTYYMYRLTYDSWDFEEVSEGADEMLLWMPQSVTVVGAAILTIAIIHSLCEVIAGREPLEKVETAE